MAGLNRILKQYGRMTVQGVRYVYDYAREEAVKEEDMPIGSERWKESERAKWESVAEGKKRGDGEE